MSVSIWDKTSFCFDDGNENAKKRNSDALDFFVHFFAVNAPWNCLISRFMEARQTDEVELSFLFLNLDMAL